MSPSDEWRREALVWLLAAGLGFLVYLVVRPFLMAMVWAAVLTVFFYPGHRWLRTRVGRPRIAALISTVIVAILLLAPMVWLVPVFVRQAVQTVGQLPSQEIREHLNAAADWVSDNVPGSAFSLEGTANDIARGDEWPAGPMVGMAGGELGGVHHRRDRLAADPFLLVS
jgi:predicted PurR-regulated permease PerM